MPMPVARCRAAAAPLVACLVLGALAGCGEQAPTAPRRPSLAEFRGQTMGTTYTVKVVTPQPLADGERSALADAVAAALDAVDRRMSTYKPDSELSRFNRHASTEPFTVSREVLEVFTRAREVSVASHGAFDVTVGPLVDAWGFGPAKRSSPPEAAEITALLPRVGYGKIALDPERLAVAKARPDVEADFSGIAKGYGADVAGRALEARGVRNYMVAVSGDIRARGHNADGQPWQIAIERPDASPQQGQYLVPLADRGISTSGDYRNYFERDGRRYSHEIDPATGHPITHRLASVSVVAAESTLADAWATALLVLGPDKGYRIAEEAGLAAFFIVRDADGTFRTRSTPAFAALGGRPL